MMKNYFRKRAEEMSSNLQVAPELKELIQESIDRYLSQQKQFDLMLSHFDLVGFGVTFANRQNQYAVVTRDASAPGKFRCTFFDARGFFGHSTRDTAVQVLLELCQSGYSQIVSENTLQKMTQTPEFILGNEAVALRHAVCEGRLDAAIADEQYESLKKRLEVA
jgi:hypothetical protein